MHKGYVYYKFSPHYTQDISQLIYVLICRKGVDGFECEESVRHYAGDLINCVLIK
mgnify:CR=1 FL=1